MTDLIAAGDILKNGLEPIGNGLRDTFGLMLIFFLNSMQELQQSAIMDHLTLIADAGIGLLISFLK